MSYNQQSIDITDLVEKLRPDTPCIFGNRFYLFSTSRGIFACISNRTNHVQLNGSGSIEAYVVTQERNTYFVDLNAGPSHAIRTCTHDETLKLAQAEQLQIDDELTLTAHSDTHEQITIQGSIVLTMGGTKYEIKDRFPPRDLIQTAITRLSQKQPIISFKFFPNFEVIQTKSGKIFLVDRTYYLGKGGFGEIYFSYPCTQIENNTWSYQRNNRSAVKIIAAQHFIDDAKKESLKNEVIILRSYYSGDTDSFVSSKGEAYIFMPYFPGKTLDHLINPKESLPFSIFTQLLLSICQHFVLMANPRKNSPVHLHLDLKPDNILYHIIIDKNGHQRVDTFPLDFGLSLAMPELNRIYRIDYHVGTTLYAAPEMMDCMPSITSDVFSLGIIFVQLLGATQALNLRDSAQGGRHNCFAITAMGIDTKGLFDDLEIPKAVRKPLFTFLQRMLHMDWNERPSMDEVLQFFVALNQYQLLWDTLKPATECSTSESIGEDKAAASATSETDGDEEGPVPPRKEDLVPILKKMTALTQPHFNDQWDKQQHDYNTFMEKLLNAEIVMDYPGAQALAHNPTFVKQHLSLESHHIGNALRNNPTITNAQLYFRALNRLSAFGMPLDDGLKEQLKNAPAICMSVAKKNHQELIQYYSKLPTRKLQALKIELPEETFRKICNHRLLFIGLLFCNTSEEVYQLLTVHRRTLKSTGPSSHDLSQQGTFSPPSQAYSATSQESKAVDDEAALTLLMPGGSPR